ncbi:hypothetical protein EFW58_01323 [Bacillus velezensis]|nr:hypothetical protein EFW58_01323 [Bacillus velezensis]
MNRLYQPVFLMSGHLTNVSACDIFAQRKLFVLCQSFVLKYKELS